MPAAYIAGIIPGLPQLLNGEYAEAFLYMGYAGLGLLMALKPEGLSDETENTNKYSSSYKTIQEKEAELNAVRIMGYFSLGSAAFLSYVDGVHTTKSRYKEWETVERDYELAIQRSIDEQNAAAVRALEQEEIRKQKEIDDKLAAEERARQQEEEQRQKEIQRVAFERRLNDKKIELLSADHPICISEIAVTKNKNIASVSYTVENISEKTIDFILIELRPVDSAGKWILPYEESLTNVKTLRFPVKLESGTEERLSEKIPWNYSTLNAAEIMYLKIKFADGSVYEQGDTVVLNKTLIFEKDDNK